MKRRILIGMVVAHLTLAVAAVPGDIAEERTGSPQSAPGSEAQKKGSGVVPEGVRLSPQMPRAAAPAQFRFPKAVTKTLENGLRVFVIPDAEQPMISVRLVLAAAGSINDPAGKPGVAAMTADLLAQGTASRSAQDIAQSIDFVGGNLNASSDQDGTYVNVTSVKKDFALAMDLLSDIVLHPAFKDEELDRRRQQALSNLQMQYSDPAYVADQLLSRVIYGQHPYGLPGSGTPTSLPMIGRDDLARFKESHYTPDQSFVAFAGDVAPESALAAAEKYLGAAGWPKQKTAGAIPPAPAAISGMRILLVDKPDANQTQIRAGRLGIPRNNPDYIPLHVTNRIFGGGFNSRLSTEVRQKKGLTYGAYSQFDSYRLAGDFSASTFTRTEATAEATKLIVDLIARMSTGELDAKELDFARDYLAGVFPIQSETGEQVAGRILTVAQFGLPSDYNDTYPQKVLSISPEDVKAMAGKYFDSKNLVLVLVGNVKEFRASIQKQFPSGKFEEIPFDRVDLLAPGLKKVKTSAAP